MILIKKIKFYLTEFVIRPNQYEQKIEKIFHDYSSVHYNRGQVVQNLMSMKREGEIESASWLISDAIDFDLADENSEGETNAWKKIIESLRLEFPVIYKKYILLQDLYTNMMSWFSSVKSEEDELVFRRQNALRLEALENIVKRDSKKFTEEDLLKIGKIYTLIFF